MPKTDLFIDKDTYKVLEDEARAQGINVNKLIKNILVGYSKGIVGFTSSKVDLDDKIINATTKDDIIDTLASAFSMTKKEVHDNLENMGLYGMDKWYSMLALMASKRAPFDEVISTAIKLRYFEIAAIKLKDMSISKVDMFLKRVDNQRKHSIINDKYWNTKDAVNYKSLVKEAKAFMYRFKDIKNEDLEVE